MTDKIEMKFATPMEGPGVSRQRGCTEKVELAEAIRLETAGFAEPTDRKAFNEAKRIVEEQAFQEAEKRRKAAAEAEQAGPEADQSGGDEGSEDEAAVAALETATKAIADGEIPEDLAEAGSDDGMIIRAEMVKIAAAEGVEVGTKDTKPVIAAAILASRTLKAAVEEAAS